MGATAIVGAIMTGVSMIGGTIASMQTAEHNADVYRAAAQNVDSQKEITAGQYRNKAAKLAGEASATAARGGLTLSGSTAQSISQSLTQLGIDQSYEQFNLDVEKSRYLNEADYQKHLRKQSGISLLFGLPITALSSGSDYASKYWGKNKGSVTGFTPSMTPNSSVTGNTSGYMGTLPKL